MSPSLSNDDHIRPDSHYSALPNLNNAFSLKGVSRSYDHQYASLYFSRLVHLRPPVKARAEKKWKGAQGNPKPMERVLDVQQGELCWITGTIYMDMPLKPNVLDDISKDKWITAPPPRETFFSSEDEILLEDESGRVKLVGERLKHVNLVTGVVLAALGYEAAAGEFEVVDLCFAGLPPRFDYSAKPKEAQKTKVKGKPVLAEADPNPEIEQDGSWVALVSGLDITGGESVADLRWALLVEWLMGEAGSDLDRESGGKVSQLILAGNSLATPSTVDDPDKARVYGYDPTTYSTLPIQTLDNLLYSLAPLMPITLLPGPNDPSGTILPQQPLPRLMFKRTSPHDSFRTTTNPSWLQVGGKRFLGGAGQTVDDVFKYLPENDGSRIGLVRDMLHWRCMAPTAPDTLWCHPFDKGDPFLLEHAPDVFFIGNQPSFQTCTVSDADDSLTRIVLIPKFSETGTVVLVHTSSLEVKTMEFGVFAWDGAGNEATASYPASSRSHQMAESISTWKERRTRLLAALDQPIDQQDEDLIGKLIDVTLTESRTGETGDAEEEVRSKVKELGIRTDDFVPVSHIAQGQFGTVDLVRCKFDDELYCMKTMSKVTLRRSRQHTSPIPERILHTLALTTNSIFSPQILCAFQSPLSLHLIMDFIPYGTLWDVLISTPSSRLPESDVRYWSVGMVCAVEWLSDNGWAHRDLKPHNFLIRPGENNRMPRAVLTDFGTAAQALPEGRNKNRKVLPITACLWPVGTPDYIAPEILEAHEDALVRAEEDEERAEDSEEKSEEGGKSRSAETEGYGIQVDWWSLGVIISELLFGEPPFFAESIADTYWKIVNFEDSLKFPPEVDMSSEFEDLIRRLLKHSTERLGRNGTSEVKFHPWFRDVIWPSTSCTPPSGIPPPELFLPPPPPVPQYSQHPFDLSLSNLYEGQGDGEDDNNPFAFSDLFISSPGLSVLHSRESPLRSNQDPNRMKLTGISWLGGSPQSFAPPDRVSSLSEAFDRSLIFHDIAEEKVRSSELADEWTGFTWGPTQDAFEVKRLNRLPLEFMTPFDQPVLNSFPGEDDFLAFSFDGKALESPFTPASIKRHRDQTPHRPLLPPDSKRPPNPTMSSRKNVYQTPARSSASFSASFPMSAPYSHGNRIPSTASRRSRPVTDVKALQQMVDCIGLSARKRVLESGKKPRLLVLRRWKRSSSHGEDSQEEEKDPREERQIGSSRATGWTPSPSRAMHFSADAGSPSNKPSSWRLRGELSKDVDLDDDDGVEINGGGSKGFSKRIEELESRRKLLVGELDKVKDGLVGVRQTVDKWDRTKEHAGV
ncbi:DNA polymerase delta, regulatory subunit 55 [Phaffia rhodozyma]|uniref:DNA-directed DNA polymerase n=1 Tax=Phaffia rhodozyma TaxID=264483 RepID=A0A0F7SRH3_PHARH|nr:DNA polymerase delta, regulatory subunit 55 [Phaffia rhodozyma]